MDRQFSLWFVSGHCLFCLSLSHQALLTLHVAGVKWVLHDAANLQHLTDASQAHVSCLLHDSLSLW